MDGRQRQINNPSNYEMLIDSLKPIDDAVEAAYKDIYEQSIGPTASQHDKILSATSVVGDVVYSDTNLQPLAIRSAEMIGASEGIIPSDNEGEVSSSTTTALRDDYNANESSTGQEQMIHSFPVVSGSHLLVQNKLSKDLNGHNNDCYSSEEWSEQKQCNKPLSSCGEYQQLCKQLQQEPNGHLPKRNDSSLLKNGASLSLEQVEPLNDKSRSREDVWMERYNDLLEFVRENGHTLVPKIYTPKPKLHNWIMWQRYNRKRMSLKHINMLSQINFVWDSHELRWREKFQRLVEYKKIHGHTNVPYRYMKDKKLSTWVKCQRRYYRLYFKGGTSAITKERIEALNGIGFDWDPKNVKKK